MNANSDTDSVAASLVVRIASGEQQAMDEFFRLFERNIYAFAQSRLNDPHAAADVVNEVMLAVWRTADRFKGASRVQTWVLGIANYKVLDILRSRAKRDHTELGVEIEDGESETGERNAESGQHRDRIRRCLARLTDAHRQVVHLAFFEDLSYNEIAGIVDCPAGTVKTRMYHARLALKRCLEGFGLTGEQIS